MALEWFVPVKLPENILFTPFMHNPGDELEWGIIFYMFPVSAVPLTFPITNNISPVCVVGLYLPSRIWNCT